VVTKIEPNLPREKTIWQTSQAGARELGFSDVQIEKMVFSEQPTLKPDPKSVDNDFALLDEYIRFKGHKPNGAYAAEAKSTWEEFKHFSAGKLLKDCTRSDGIAFVQHLRKRGLKTATVVKKVNFLAAPINHGNETGDASGNPFFRVIDRKNDALQRLCFDNHDMKLCRDHMLPLLERDERLMWLFLATTGMRHSEAFSIREEFCEGLIRFVRVGQKTDTSRRSVPLPDCLLPHIPRKIDQPMFEDSSLKNISKNLLRALRRVGINDHRKVVYSLRHRAHTRLREAECPDDIQREIVGHETGEAHVQYGRYPIRVVKTWIDVIGY
jgi:integrase